MAVFNGAFWRDATLSAGHYLRSLALYWTWMTLNRVRDLHSREHDIAPIYIVFTVPGWEKLEKYARATWGDGDWTVTINPPGVCAANVHTLQTLC